MRKREEHHNDKSVISKNKAVIDIISRIQKGKMDCFEIPEEYSGNRDIIFAERSLGIRRVGRKGYDVIRDEFFVEEALSNEYRTQHLVTWFPTFAQYYEFLDGQIYEDACYYQCEFSGNTKAALEVEKLKERKSFTDKEIGSYTLAPNQEELDEYNTAERTKTQIKKVIDKYLNCTSGDELVKIEKHLRKAKPFSGLDRRWWSSYPSPFLFFLWNYAYSAQNDKDRFAALMDFLSNFACAGSIVRELCAVFNPDEVVAAYHYSNNSKQGEYLQKKRLRDFAAAIKNDLVDKRTFAFFDATYHYYCEQSVYSLQEEKTWRSEGMGEFSTFRYFETFDEFLDYRQGDLTNTDLSKDIRLNYDLSKCKMDETTKLPQIDGGNLEYILKKEYSDGEYSVSQAWYSPDNKLVKSYQHKFKYFFDFVAFLKGDLSGADLLLCDGLKNLKDITEIDFTDAKLTSSVCEKLGIYYTPYEIDYAKVESFYESVKNEKSTELTLLSPRESTDSDNQLLSPISDYSRSSDRIYYVSDLHLMHRLSRYQPKSIEDVAYVLRPIVDTLVQEAGHVVLIGGDISSDFEIYAFFLRLLKDELTKRGRNPHLILILGNHELWEFPESSFDGIVHEYQKLASELGMHLLQNDILFVDSERGISRITNQELLKATREELREILRTARTIFFGGLAFSGCNEDFNANNGIYRGTIDRETEIKESQRFEELYNRVLSVIPDKPLIVFTHTPMVCWRKKVEYHKNYVYVSGHTHRNYFYDDGEIRVYADNQIGYSNNSPHLKWFDVDNEYDYFVDYEDGIHCIDRNDYLGFYRGKNLDVNYNRTADALYMLKKNGYYCFIHESKNGALSILNGGALKKLDGHPLRYYYNNMDSVIDQIKKPLDAYTRIQERISSEIRSLGGIGSIHGCIIDIDFYNHVYINPVDMKITGYWASDIIQKKVYPTVPALLREQCPVLYNKYIRLLNESTDNHSMLTAGSDADLSVLPQDYLDTDIYRASREIKKMQKLSSNILTTWIMAHTETKMIE